LPSFVSKFERSGIPWHHPAREAANVLGLAEGDEVLLTEAPTGSFGTTPYDPDFADAMEAAESFMARYRNALRELAK